MKAYKLLSIVGLVLLVGSERLIPPSDSSPLVVPTIDAANKYLDLANITIASSSDPNHLVRVSAINDVDYYKAVCRGRKLFLAMTQGSDQGTRYIDPLNTPWDGGLEKEMVSWGWDDWASEDGWCTFDEDGLGSALRALRISDKSGDEGGDNTCWITSHYDSPGVIFDPNNPEHVDDDGLLKLRKDNQYYMDPNGVKKRCTGALYVFGVNARAGVLYFAARRSPVEAAKEFWDKTPETSELPDLRASSDLAWSIWNKQRGPDHINDIRKIFSLHIINEETNGILDRAVAKQGVREVKMWPGTDVDANSEEGLAIIGSANGRAGGYFLAQHKRQLGGNKYISKITVFRSDVTYALQRNILFWIDDVPSPPPEIAVPDDDKMDTGTGRMESKLVSRDHGRSLTRKHVVWVRP